MTDYDKWKLREPSEPRVIFYDWQGEAIYEGNEYYETIDGKVLADDKHIEEFDKEMLGKKLVAEESGE